MSPKKITLLTISIPWILFLIQGYYLAIFANGPSGGLMLLTVFWGIVGVFLGIYADALYNFVKTIVEGD